MVADDPVMLICWAWSSVLGGNWVSKGNAARPQPPQGGPHPQDGKAGQMPAETEAGQVSAGERAAGWVGLAVVAVLALICLDLATGGWLSGKISAAPKAGGCGGCGE